MVGLLVTGHGEFAVGMQSAAKMIAGESEIIKYVKFEEGMSTEQLADQLNAAFDSLKGCDGVLVLADLPGGSPFKTAVECKYARPDQAIEVVAGTNLPMIVTGATLVEDETDPQALADELIELGRECVVNFTLEEHQDDAEEDGI